MTENTKKWLTVAGCLVVCAILVAVIASSFSKDKVTDDLLPPSSSQQGDVVVDPDSSTPPPAESGDDQKPGDNVTVNPETRMPVPTPMMETALIYRHRADHSAGPGQTGIYRG